MKEKGDIMVGVCSEELMVQRAEGRVKALQQSLYAQFVECGGTRAFTRT